MKEALETAINWTFCGYKFALGKEEKREQSIQYTP